MDTNPAELSYRLVTVSGRIASGSTTLAKKLAHALRWKRIEGGDIFWEAVRTKLGLDAKDTGLRPDEEDKAFDAMQKEILAEREQIIVESKLAGFIAKDLPDVFRVLVQCVDPEGADQTSAQTSETMRVSFARVAPPVTSVICAMRGLRSRSLVSRTEVQGKLAALIGEARF